MNRKEQNRRLIMMVITYLELLVQVGLYEIVWYYYYYLKIIRYDSKLYFKGFILVLAIYMVFLYLFTNTYGGLKIGMMKRMELFLSHFFRKNRFGRFKFRGADRYGKTAGKAGNQAIFNAF